MMRNKYTLWLKEQIRLYTKMENVTRIGEYAPSKYVNQEHPDKYILWLDEQIETYIKLVREDAAKIGRPDQLKFANQVLRDTLETYQECLDKYREINDEND